MSEQPPKIEFPAANYPIKVVGMAGEEYRAFVIAALHDLQVKFDADSISVRPSSAGTYCAYSIRITAQSPEQLELINERLRADPRTKTVL